jgi:uncharacterized protein (TIGR00369 family)
MSGLEFLRAIVNGDLPQPPIGHLLNMKIVGGEEGRAEFRITPSEEHYNPIGVVHGGIASTILDSAMACAIQTMLPLGVAYTTIELHINLLRAITLEAGELRAIGEAIHVGRRIGTAQGKLIDKDGKLYAHGTTTCIILSQED